MKKILISLFVAFLVFGCLGPVENTNTSGQQNITQTPPVVNEPNETEMIVPVEPEPNITENETIIKPPVVVEEQIPMINLTQSQIMASEMSKLKSPMGGPYDILSYEWATQNPNLDPQLVAITTPIDIFFNDKKESNLVGLGFQIYTDKMNSSTANGFAVVVNESDVLNPLLNGQFDLDFLVPGISKELLGCQMTSKDSYISGINNAEIVIYGFDCINVI